MALIVSISPKELERQAQLVFEGEVLKVMLCNMVSTEYTSTSTVAQWQSIELSGNGYQRYSTTIPVGSYDSVLAYYVIPEISATFSATGLWSFNRVVIYIDGATYPHSVIQENPNISLSAGQSQTYLIKLAQDD